MYRIFFSHFKSETELVRNIADKNILPNLVQEYISFYNQARFQKRLDQLSPIEYRKKLAD
ncbi:IS3 family transposase [Bilophila wadsworthia]|uniref:IS3 family transposase n=1 Tax=Bilophila wadsworthia TaxID=35833 RepID=UPI0034621208